MLLTGCWACDEYTKEGGSTLVIPGSNNLRRHPDGAEVQELAGAIPIECPPVALPCGTAMSGIQTIPGKWKVNG